MGVRAPGAAPMILRLAASRRGQQCRPEEDLVGPASHTQWSPPDPYPATSPAGEKDWPPESLVVAAVSGVEGRSEGWPDRRQDRGQAPRRRFSHLWQLARQDGGPPQEARMRQEAGSTRGIERAV